MRVRPRSRLFPNAFALGQGNASPFSLYLNRPGSIPYFATLSPIIRSVIPSSRAAFAMLPAAALQLLDDDLPLHVRHRGLEGALRLASPSLVPALKAGRQVVAVDYAVGCENDRPLDAVSKLPHVARPVVSS